VKQTAQTEFTWRSPARRKPLSRIDAIALSHVFCQETRG
jgi:hypothetical protein